VAGATGYVGSLLCQRLAQAGFGMGRAQRGTRVLVLMADLEVRVIAEDGALLRHLILDPSVDYQALSRSTV